MEAATLKVQKKKQNVAIAEWASTPMTNVNKTFFAQKELKFFETKNF